MNKNLAFSLFLAVTLLTTAAKAQFFTAVANGTVTIVNYLGSGPTVVIPPTIDNLPVTTIGRAGSIFNYATGPIISVTIPDTVTTISAAAFLNCRTLSAISIPDSVTNIGMQAFEFCVGMTNVTLGNGVTSIGADSFFGCVNLTSITLPDSLTALGDSAFEDCYGLTNANLPRNLSSFGLAPFQFCGLNAINIDSNNTSFISVAGVLFDHNGNTLIEYPPGPAGSYAVADGVTAIGRGAFIGTQVAAVALPATVTNIGPTAFESESLTALSVDSNNPSYAAVDGVLFNVGLTTLIQYPLGKVLNGYAIPASVTSIGDSAFFGSYLTQIAIPAGVTNIGNFAFDYCVNLTTVAIPASVRSLGYYSFFGCTALTGVYFAGDAPSIGSAVFYQGNPALSLYYLPGASGWASTFGRIATFLWNPTIQMADGAFGVQNNQFGFNITGTTNIPFVLEASTDLSGSTWTPLQSVILTNGSFYFTDPQWSNYPGRFYRIHSP